MAKPAETIDAETNKNIWGWLWRHQGVGRSSTVAEVLKYMFWPENPVNFMFLNALDHQILAISSNQIR